MLRSLFGWLEKCPAPDFDEKELRTVPKMIFGVAVLVLVGLFIGVALKPELGQKEFFGGDFLAFYFSGQMLNNHPPEQLYSHDLQEKYHLAVRPADQFLRIYWAYPPFLAQVFRPFALLPYGVSFAVWAVLAVGVFAVALRFVLRGFGPASVDLRERAFWLALSFQPFLFETWLGGQLSGFAFAFYGAAIVLEMRGRPLLSGLVLSLCLYKPQLLFAALPMLVLTRRWKTLAGFAAGAVSIVTATGLTMGWRVFALQYEAMQYFARNVTSEAGRLKEIKYVDLNNFSRLLAGDGWRIVLLCLGPFVLAAVARLAWEWWRTQPDDEAARAMNWSLLLTWGLIFAAYLAVYDTTLALLPLLLVTGLVTEQFTRPLPRMMKLFLAAFYFVPWVTSHAAKVTGLQLYTLLIALFGLYQFHLLDEMRKARAAEAPGLLRSDQGLG